MPLCSKHSVFTFSRLRDIGIPECVNLGLLRSHVVRTGGWEASGSGSLAVFGYLDSTSSESSESPDYVTAIERVDRALRSPKHLTVHLQHYVQKPPFRSLAICLCCSNVLGFFTVSRVRRCTIPHQVAPKLDELLVIGGMNLRYRLEKPLLGAQSLYTASHPVLSPFFSVRSLTKPSSWSCRLFGRPSLAPESLPHTFE